MFTRMNAEEKERIIKFILCFILGMGATILLGNPYSTTVAISAILVLYNDRGFVGTFTYHRRRIGTQIFMGAVMVGIILLFRAIWPEVPDEALLIVVP